MVGIISVIWVANCVRFSTPKMLCDLFEKKRIYVPDGDADQSYLRLLENYRDALANPKRYFLSGFPMIVGGILGAYGTVYYLSIVHPNIFATILVAGGTLLLVLSI